MANCVKYIKFCGEVIGVPQNVTFWVQHRGDEYAMSYCVNMSLLDKRDILNDPAVDSIIISEGYTSHDAAYARLDEILHLLNS